MNFIKKYMKIDLNQKGPEKIEDKFLPAYYFLGECYISGVTRAGQDRQGQRLFHRRLLEHSQGIV
jgi:hypothetical protein